MCVIHGNFLFILLYFMYGPLSTSKLLIILLLCVVLEGHGVSVVNISMKSNDSKTI